MAGRQATPLTSAPERMRTAVHEAGHAVVGYALGATIHRVAVFPDGSGRAFSRWRHLSGAHAAAFLAAGAEAEFLSFGDAGDVAALRIDAQLMRQRVSSPSDAWLAGGAHAYALLAKNRANLDELAAKVAAQRQVYGPQLDRLLREVRP